MIEPAHLELSLRRQCELLRLSRSAWCYEPAHESAETLCLMRLLDEQCTRTPLYGLPRMTAYLREDLGWLVNHKRVQRLTLAPHCVWCSAGVQIMGIQAICPQPRTTVPDAAQHRYPYLLRSVTIAHPDQVWSADITYVLMLHGFMYLVAILDRFSCYVIT